MVQVNVNVFWSAGPGDGDNYYTEYELTDEQYALFRKFLRDGSEPEDHKEIAKIWEGIVQELSDDLMVNSLEYEEEAYRDECLIDPDSDEYDLDDEEEQFTMDIYEWWEEHYTPGAELLDFEVTEYEFKITLSDGIESSFKYNLYEDEAERLDDLINENKPLNELKNDSDYSYLYEELLAALRKNLKEDIDLSKDDINIQFEMEYC